MAKQFLMQHPLEIRLLNTVSSATGIFALMVRDQKLLIGHRHYTADVWKSVSVWTIPGGRTDEGETVEQTLRREIFEEVGIKTFSIVDFIAEVPGAKEGDTVQIFHCTTSEDAILMEPEKFSEWRWISFQEYFTIEEYGSFNHAVFLAITTYLKKTYSR